jgi:periplasmic mercuric ion binding protein
MKTINKTVFAVFMLTALTFMFQNTNAQTAKSGTKTIKIKTTAICDMCKDRITKGLSYDKGVKSTNLDIPTKTLTIVYDESKTTPEKIKVAITKVGYDADEMKADKVAYEKLPACCKSGKKCDHDKE